LVRRHHSCTSTRAFVINFEERKSEEKDRGQPAGVGCFVWRVLDDAN
jgi:hypothetical protein